MELRKSHLAAAVGAALLVGGTAVQAQNLQVQLYGQVHRAMMFVDDGHQSKWFNVDGQPSSTRFGITGSAQATPGLRVGARIESEMKSNPSNVVTFADPSTGAVGGNVLFAERWLDLSFAGAWGTINVGQGSGGADDASTIDLSGTALANGNCVCDWGGGISTRTAAGGTGPTIGAAFEQNDFESRYDRIMYTTPVFNGFRAQASYGQKSDPGEAIEASLWWSGKVAGDLSMAIGWSEVRTGTGPTVPDRTTIGGSISWLHTSGFNVTLAYTSLELSVAAPRDDDVATWVKVGYKWGPHAIAVDYLMKENGAANNEEGKSYGIGYQWNPIRWLEIYGQYRIFQLERTVGATTTSFEDVTVASIGSRVRF